ncbi:peptide chain release factor N(5)-glutamine methyltransferase [Oleiagrimonas sp. MCCC 1A03011]|jgi:release factor glutamine methyltransferase|uniref:peptide chain release factor N(5)-glutamine methyltransferase n=1 Tax=Oleiagrimonas sp. MCCC 1A03011 TaxID=1926883 RepID=UPI000DC2BBE2|nr:peptide chain release factor N(5)-glutamine methyltransferase [Oleiagrimonas sp. MCCC 1A03011]RAP59439.1 protein-(glutamine-N5) methyltransferase, release factor-specific [Oleiagrimonas sp. MCCC 1A03011]
MVRTPQVRDLLMSAAERVAERGDAEWLLMHVLGVDRAWLFAHATDPVDAASAQAFEALLQRREQGEPVAYILGRRGFWHLDLEVTPDTLIPRPETELLVELALQRMPQDVPLQVVDLGTGSGAIALALASERPQAQVTAVDVSASALQVARRNALANGLERVEFLQGDWYGPLADRQFDLIVSNPPYIEHDDAHVGQGDLRFEPRGALVSGADGLDAIRVLVAGARRHLRARGWLLMEHGWKQGPAVRALLTDDGGFTHVFTACDLEGRERVSGARFRSP